MAIAFPSHFDRDPLVDGLGLSPREPDSPRAGFSYAGRDAGALFDHLDRTVFDGGFPAAEYDGMRHRVYAVPASETAIVDRLVKCGDDEVVAVVEYPGGLGRLGPADERRFPVHLRAGARCREMAEELLHAAGEDTSFARGLNGLFRGDYRRGLITLARTGELHVASLGEYLPLAKLLAVHNSFASCATRQYEDLRRGGYLFTSWQDVIDWVSRESGLAEVIRSIPAAIEHAGPPEVLRFARRGEEVVGELMARFDRIRTFLPRTETLSYVFMRTFTRLLEAGGAASDWFREVAEARQTFEEAMVTSAGTQLYESLLGPRGRDLTAKSGPLFELAVGGGTIGVLPFAIGTVYQIVYDLVNLVVDLLWYGRWMVEGLLGWLLAPAEAPRDDMIEPDQSVIDAFSFGFTLEELPGDIVDIVQAIVEMGSGLLESFVEHAAHYGEVVGRALASGSLALVDGALSLVVSGHPGNYNLLDHLWWQCTRWFNIGCLIGPIAVDLVLMFCSGGASGIFSLAAKAGKADKLYDAFRFATKTGTWLANSALYARIAGLVPPRLVPLLKRLIGQLYALSGRLTARLVTLLRVINEKLPKKSRIPGDQLTALGQKLDGWYDMAEVANLFAALAWFFLDGTDAEITSQGTVAVA